jgi:DNA-binding CsgD family transcriptional regulator
MTRISKRTLQKPAVKRAEKELVHCLLKNKTDDETAVALNELLSDSEYTMLTKRITAIIMFSQGLSSYRVHKLLKMSSQTTAKLLKSFAKGEYTHLAPAPNPELVKFFEKAEKHSWEDKMIYDAWGKILRGGMPSYTDRRIVKNRR